MEASPRRIIYLLVGLASIFIITWGIRSSAKIINPILLAMVITMTVIPIPGRLRQRGLPDWLSLLLTIVLVVGSLLVVLLFSAYAIGLLAAAIPTYANDVTLQQGQAAASQTPRGLIWLAESLSTIITSQQFSAVALKVVEIVGNGMVEVFLVLLIFAFMLSAAIALPRVSRTGLDLNNPVLGHVATLTGDVRQYMVIMTLVNFLVGLGNTIILWVLGVDFAILWGILAWVLGYIPSVGFWLALIPPVILAYAEFGFTTALIVFVAYVLINGGVQNLVQPRLMGQGLNISPLVVFISVFVWGWLLGGIGAILSVPLTMIILQIVGSFPSSQWLLALVRYAPADDSSEKALAQEGFRHGWSRFRRLLQPQEAD